MIDNWPDWAKGIVLAVVMLMTGLDLPGDSATQAETLGDTQLWVVADSDAPDDGLY